MKKKIFIVLLFDYDTFGYHEIRNHEIFFYHEIFFPPILLIVFEEIELNLFDVFLLDFNGLFSLVFFITENLFKHLDLNFFSVIKII